MHTQKSQLPLRIEFEACDALLSALQKLTDRETLLPEELFEVAALRFSIARAFAFKRGRDSAA
jgi:hypothetical protein